MEIIVSLAVIGIIVGAVTPLALEKVESARITRALKDTEVVKAAIIQFKVDTQMYPLYKNKIAVKSECFTWAKSKCWAFLKTSDVAYIPNYGGRAFPWSSSSFLDNIKNHLISPKTGKYGTADPIRIGSGWNGPYLDRELADPWGRAYIVYTQGFANPNRVPRVLSGGPDKELDTDVGLDPTDERDDALKNTDDDIGHYIDQVIVE